MAEGHTFVSLTARRRDYISHQLLLAFIRSHNYKACFVVYVTLHIMSNLPHGQNTRTYVHHRATI